MNPYTRRTFCSAVLAGGVLAARQAMAAKEVVLGVQGWSFRRLSLDDAIKGTLQAGLNAMELGWNHVEPAGLSREDMRKWRLTTPVSTYREIRDKVQGAGIKIVAYSATLRSDFTDEEIVKTFEMAAAFGVNTITTSTNVSMSERLDTFAKKYKMRVGFHNHSRIRPDEFATPDDFATALRGRSRYMGINLDVGHFWAAGFDPVAYIKKHHSRIWSLHLKDRKKNQGPDLPFGEGDTPLKDILLLLKKEQYGFPAVIEFELKGTDPVAGVKQCADYCKKVLAG